MVNINRLVLVLLVVAVASAILLAEINTITAPKIQASQTAYKLKAVQKVLPPYDNQPAADRQVIPVTGGGPAEAKGELDEELGKEGVVVYPAYQAGKLVGEAYSVISHQGFSGDIEILLGVSPAGRVTGVEIIAHAETPGLGAKIVSEASWKGKVQVVGRSLSESLVVKKDGGEIDAIAGATISPRAVCGAVKAGLEVYNQAFKDKVPAASPAAPIPTAAAPQGAHS